jgi:transcriptional regulator with XRE-family HTH domain
VGVTVDFLVALQKSGWVLDRVLEDSVSVSCPQPGCQVRTRFRPEVKIPSACGVQSQGAIIIGGYDEARKALKERRQVLGLSIPDVEDIVGCADDHIAKAERDSYNDPSLTTRRTPNAQLLIDWANGLGFDVAFIPREMPRKALFVLADTRHKLIARWRASGVVAVPSKPANDSGETL